MTDHTDDIAAPMDMLLVNSTTSFVSRMFPNGSWRRLAESIAARPRAVADRTAAWAGELAEIVGGESNRRPTKGDFRFSDSAWTTNPLFERLCKSYLATGDFAQDILDGADLSWSDKAKMQFVFDNMIEGLSPSNNPLLSPLGWKALIDTGGASAIHGARAFVRDMSSRPRVPSMVEPDAFTVGEDLAITPGAVVLRTPMFELIQYAPRTETVTSVPLLVVPPVINRYYVLDLAPGRSMFEHYLDQGIPVFTMSWRNPSACHRDWGSDEYGAAILEAIDAVRTIAGTDATNVYATCSGGQLTAMALAHLTAIGRASHVASLTLGVTVLDQRNAGFAPAALDERTAAAAVKASADAGYLDGAALAEVFAWLRPTDLVWRYWVNNYVQGRSPAPFDILFWNADTTRLTAALHRDLVYIGLDNQLATPGAATMLGTPVDLSTVTVPAYAVGGIADHICPWQSTYRSAQLLGGVDNRYVLASSGHIASLVNPPGNPRATFRTARVDAQVSADEWLAPLEKHSGTWWSDHITWLAQHSGGSRPAPTRLGGRGYEPLAPAPGTYIHER